MKPCGRYRKTRKQRRFTNQKLQTGGFYPSVYGGVCGARLLLPLILKQAFGLYNRASSATAKKQKKQKKPKAKGKSRKTKKNKRG
jgi:hypothetical protein